jgi:hypothetical protein
MRSRFVLLAVGCLLATAGAADSLSVEVPAHPRLQVYATEFGAGLGTFVLGEVAGGGAGYVGTFMLAYSLMAGIAGRAVIGVTIGAAGMVIAAAGVGMVVWAPGASGLFVARVGDRWAEGGSKVAAIEGAYAGVVPGAGIAYTGLRLAYSRHNGWLGLPLYVLGVFCVPAGATVGYNLSVHRKPLSISLEKRLEPPELTFTSIEGPDHTLGYGVKIRLAGLKF